MSVKSFLKLVEIQTKLASIIPFLLGTIYALYHYNRFNAGNFIVLFISIVTFDMATTAINNYFDYKRAYKKYGYNYERHNAIVKDNLSEKKVIAVIMIMLTVAIVFGIVLLLNTGIIVLFIGVVSFAVGILYSFGPVPISRTPLGELFSGLFMGFIIVFVSIFVHTFDLDLVSITLNSNIVTMNMDLVAIFYIFLYSVPTMFGIANIMLANNICDIEDDIENKRYTLPVYIGKKKALFLFKILYYAIFADLVLLSLLRITPFITLLILVALIPVNKNIKEFYEKQTKEETFVLSVKNFVLINIAQIVLFGAAIIPLSKYVV